MAERGEISGRKEPGRRGEVSILGGVLLRLGEVASASVLGTHTPLMRSEPGDGGLLAPSVDFCSRYVT